MDSERKKQKELDDELQLLLDEWKSGKINNIHELMRLIDIVYRDWLDFHPDEKEKIHRQAYGDLHVSRPKPDQPRQPAKLSRRERRKASRRNKRKV